MGKKAASSAKPKPEADGKVKRLAVTKGKGVVKSDPSCSDLSKGRRLFRRSSDETAERAMTLKLGMFDKRQVEENRDEEGIRSSLRLK